jgi:hypothetical protein
MRMDSAAASAALVSVTTAFPGDDLGNGLGIVRLQDPAFPDRVIHMEETQADGVLPVSPATSPGLKDAGLLDAGLLIEIVTIEDERFALGVEHAPEGLLGVAALPDVVKFGNIKAAGAYQIPDVAVPVKQFPAVCAPVAEPQERSSHRDGPATTNPQATERHPCTQYAMKVSGKQLQNPHE